MKRNLNVWEKTGGEKLERHMRYDLCLSEIEKDVVAAWDPNKAFAIISRWFNIGIECGYRMKGKEIERQAARRAQAGKGEL